MNLICPSCGQAGDGKKFSRVGNRKLLCNNCKALLQLAIKCPSCDGIITMPFFSTIRTNRLIRFLNMRIFSGSGRGIIQCPVCDYKAVAEKFERVAVFKEEYSVIIS